MTINLSQSLSLTSERQTGSWTNLLWKIGPNFSDVIKPLFLQEKKRKTFVKWIFNDVYGSGLGCWFKSSTCSVSSKHNIYPGNNQVQPTAPVSRVGPGQGRGFVTSRTVFTDVDSRLNGTLSYLRRTELSLLQRRPPGRRRTSNCREQRRDLGSGFSEEDVSWYFYAH